MLSKVCTKCKIEKDTAAFGKDPGHKDGLRCWCKSCSVVATSVWHKTDAGKLSIREAQYKRFYGKGMTVSRYDEMFQKQGGVCAICGQPETIIDKRYGKVRVLATDHCHETKKVRGLLCHSCNVAIGLLKHDIVRLSKAVDYLKGVV